MKLLFDATELSYYNDNDGHRAGVFYVALNLYKELKKLNIDIDFICNYKRYYFLKQIDFFKDIKILEENSLINRLFAKLIYYTRNFPIRIKYCILIMTRFYDEYFYRINKKNLAQIKNYNIYFSPYTPPNKEIEQSNLKIFRMLHDTIPIQEHGYPKSPKDWYYRIYNNINDKDFYLTNSECTRKDVLKYFSFVKENNIKTTLLGASSYFQQSKEEVPIEGKYIFSLCTIGKRKNLEFSIRTFFKFIEKENIQDLKLVLGGSVWTKYEKTLKSVLSNYDSSKVVLTGYLREEELAKYYSNALCFIFPSLYEGFGLPVLEAMQCGCPVITSKTSSLPEVIGNAGIQIDPTSDKEMIEAMTKMYKDEFFRQLCIERGLLRAQHFSWSKCASELLEFIKEKCV